MMVYRLLAVPGEGPVGPARPPCPTLFLDQTEIFLRPSPPPLSHGLDAPPPRLLSESLDLPLQI